MCCDHTFTVKDPTTGRRIGELVKEKLQDLAQYAKEMATDVDNFTMQVEQDLPPKHKANMLAALHLLDYIHVLRK